VGLGFRPTPLAGAMRSRSRRPATAALVLGGLLIAACATVTATNLCLPSEALAS
jgi:hypothetical protein